MMGTPREMVVYALRDPHEPNVVAATRYIGVTDDADARLQRHLAVAARGSSTAVSRWLRGLSAMPTIAILGTPTRARAASVERTCIRKWRAAGAPLLNKSPGGNGALSDAQRSRLAAALKERWKDPTQRARWLSATRTNQPKAAAGRRRACRDRRTAMSVHAPEGFVL